MKVQPVKDAKILPFEELKTSTCTVLAYSNVQFDLARIFTGLYITKVDVPLTTKKRAVDKKKLSAPYGAIVSTSCSNMYRGINMKSHRTHWCAANCRRMRTNNKGREVKKDTIVEESFLIEGTDVYQIRYFCTDCKQYYTLRQLEKNTNFLNQTTIEISIGEIILHIMVFKDNFKVAGCRTVDDAVVAIRILWEDHIRHMKPTLGIRPWQMGKKWQDQDPRFLFRLVMRNINFSIGFCIDRERLNRLMNEEKYRDVVHMSQCETTGNTNVNIKMHTHKPKDHRFYTLEYPKSTLRQKVCEPVVLGLADNVYGTKKKDKKIWTTMVVFSTSQVILSGRYPEVMKKRYQFFIDELIRNRHKIEEKIRAPDKTLKEYLRDRTVADDMKNNKFFQSLLGT